MIVKTGANYQAEGGYIEASAKGAVYKITKDDKSAVFGASEEKGAFIIPITFINDTDRSLLPACVFAMGSLTDVIGTPPSAVVNPNETKTINCIGLEGIRQRLSYSGSALALKYESEYATVENSGAYSAFTINKLPENGEPITIRLYV
mgnify:CR=1 FL=1